MGHRYMLEGIRGSFLEEVREELALKARDVREPPENPHLTQKKAELKGEGR